MHTSTGAVKWPYTPVKRSDRPTPQNHIRGDGLHTTTAVGARAPKAEYGTRRCAADLRALPFHGDCVMANSTNDGVPANGEQIKELLGRLQLNITDKAIAERVGIGSRTLVKLKGSERIRPWTIRKLLEWFNAPDQQATLQRRVTEAELLRDAPADNVSAGATVAPAPARGACVWNEYLPRHLPERRSWPVVGREQFVEKIKDALNVGTDGEEPGGVLLLHGIPGVGKSALAEKLAYDPDVNDAFDVILWTQLGPAPDKDKRLQEWAKALKVPPGEVERDRAAALRERLRNRPSLLLIDDVWTLDDLLPFAAIGHPETAIVLTSREKRLEDGFYGFEPTPEPLPPLDAAAAMDVLRQHAKTEVDEAPEKCRELLEALGYLPLSVHVAGLNIKAARKNAQSRSEIDKLLDDPAQVLHGQIPANCPQELAELSVSGLLELSARLLTTEQRTCFAMMHKLTPRSRFTAASMQMVWRQSIPSVNAKAVLGALADHGLVECVNADTGVYRMHSLLVAYANHLHSKRAS